MQPCAPHTPHTPDTPHTLSLDPKARNDAQLPNRDANSPHEKGVRLVGERADGSVGKHHGDRQDLGVNRCGMVCEGPRQGGARLCICDVYSSRFSVERKVFKAWCGASWTKHLRPHFNAQTLTYCPHLVGQRAILEAAAVRACGHGPADALVNKPGAGRAGGRTGQEAGQVRGGGRVRGAGGGGSRQEGVRRQWTLWQGVRTQGAGARGQRQAQVHTSVLISAWTSLQAQTRSKLRKNRWSKPGQTR